MPRPQTITKAEAIQKVVADLTGPISFDEFVNRVLAICPSTAKNPKAGIRTEVAYGTVKYGFVFLDVQRQSLAPLQVVMPGVRFRHIVKDPEAETGVLFIDPEWVSMLGHQIFQAKGFLANVQLLNEKGEPQVTQIREIQHEEQQFDQIVTVKSMGYALSDWFRAHNIQPGDSVLITIETWQPLQFRLEHEPAAQRDEQAIQSRNRELMDTLYAMLESVKGQMLSVSDAILTAHARLTNPQGYPGDPWQQTMLADGRMVSYGYDIRYAEDDDLEFFAELVGAKLPAANEESHSVSGEAAQQIYRFHCSLKHRKGLWRMIDIQGGQTLADFNSILVGAFNHDGDHMGGFWKRVRRGNTKKFREVDLGEVDPFGEGKGADKLIAELSLEVGDEIKYVYDFGDWIEHVLKLQEVLPASETQAGIEYPHIVGQNQPRYRYCRHCQEEGRKTVATYICIDCSNQQGEEVLACEECIGQYHEDHYDQEITY